MIPTLAELAGGANVAIVTLDTLRHDIAAAELAAGRTPNLGRLVETWEERHTPGSFTYAAHVAFLAGFLPTPATPGRHERPVALSFGGSETTGAGTLVLDAPDLPTGFRDLGYRTISIGGTGFFNPANPLGRALTAGFEEAHWEPAFGVTEPGSLDAQLDRLDARTAPDVGDDRPVFLLLNVATLHQPNRHHLPDAAPGPQHGDSLETHAAALRHVDARIPRLASLLSRSRPAWVAICSDHGTAYGEDGYVGHRLGHEVVWTVPYAEVVLEPGSW